MIPRQVSATELFNEPYPCQGCVHWEKCKNNNMSCKSFHIYVEQNGLLDVRYRTPSREYYRRTFLRRGGGNLIVSDGKRFGAGA